MTLANIKAGPLTNYCIVSNFVGSVTSMLWRASVIPVPAAYPSNVLVLNPIGYWRMNDVNEDGSDNGNGDDGYIANDYASGNSGIYTNVSLGNTGYNPSADPSDFSATFGFVSPYTNNLAGQIQGIDFAVTNGANAEFTVEAWVQGEPGDENPAASIVTKGLYSFDDEFSLGLDTSATPRYRFYVRNAAGTVYTADSSFIPDSNWHHLVGVCDEANGKVSLFIDGLLAASTSIPTNSGEYETTTPMAIGAGTDKTGHSYQFNGSLNDVAVFNYALTASQVASQFVNGINVAPYFIQAPPSSIIASAGGTLTITPVTAAGTLSLSYQWYDVNGNPIGGASGSTNALPLNAGLTYNNLPLSWNNGQLKLTVSNTYGATNVNVTLRVAGAPIITTNLLAQVSLGQGQSYNYIIGVVASSSTPLSYQWYNGGSPLLNQTNLTFNASIAGSYSVIMTNIYGSATSIVSTLSFLPPIGNYPYATNILGLNPVGYWPMHEVEYPAQGDTETNYGSLGLLGTGYYADWVSPGAGNGIQHGVPGALANDPDGAVSFPGETAAGNYVEGMSIPHTSPLATLNPPFSVECWINPSNSFSGDIWSQCGYVGLNAGGYGR